MNVIVILVLLAIVAVLIWYFFFRGQAPKPSGPVGVRSPLPKPDEETEPNCADPTHDPRCTILFKLLTKTVGASVENVEGCSRELAKMASEAPYDIYAIEERVDGQTAQAMFYERVHNMSQEFLIAVSEDGVVERVEAVDKMLKPGDMLAANSADVGEEYSKFISPLEPEENALHG